MKESPEMNTPYLLFCNGLLVEEEYQIVPTFNSEIFYAVILHYLHHRISTAVSMIVLDLLSTLTHLASEICMLSA